MWRRKTRKRTLGDDYSSSVKHILIPLPNFKGYHQTVSEEEGDKMFVGREAVINKLTAWLADPKSINGAYLVTGFRGMGKSSLIGQTLYKLTNGKKIARQARIIRISHWIILLVVCLLSSFCMLLPVNVLPTISWWMVTRASLLVLILSFVWVIWKKGVRLFFRFFKKGKGGSGNQHFIIIKINVGNEVLGNQEILHLITKTAYDKFKEYACNYGGSFFLSYVPLVVKLIITVSLFSSLNYPLLVPANKYWLWGAASFLELLNHFCYLTYPLLFLLIYSFVSAIGQRILYWAGNVEDLPFQTNYGLLRRLYRLHERSIATVSDDFSSVNQRITFNIFRRKEYRAPSVHEMEQELISIFRDMGKLAFGKPRIIIVLDELDKVNPSAEELDNETVPEFNPSVGGVNGKNGPRSRQRELLRMLANMKYFMSTVRAKFIFIAGRELYEAYLKDVSDREFSVSSIFNGVINVNSFLKSGTSGTDITSMTEQFVCSRLMPQGQERTLEAYYKEKMKEINKLSAEERGVQLKRLSRNVCLLYQFILYLVHVSNGSPKKIAIYFEKFIRTRDYLEGIKKYWLDEPRWKCNYYLSFGTKDIQKIGFVHYVVYPVTQIMINKSKVYEDRLLVSTSFMINHIYKYHNTGFSWRNLEHIPELLEINKTPELRDFIGTIISFLRKTHLTRILSGLYLFKFPMKISEEISFMSKQSEDLSALFNFSQDEALSIRKHYIKLLSYYTQDINKIEGCELHAMASIHHILGDLYHEDEDYSQAIFEYQTGLQLLSRQLSGKEYDKDAHWVSYMLFLVRNMLKLGLTYEKRKTLDSAYLAYSELVQHMVDYRFFEEKDFGLQYRIEDETGRTDKDALLFFNVPIGSQKARVMFPGFDEAKQREGFAFQSDHLKTEFARLLTPLKNSVITRMSFFDDIRMAYLPILAKLSVLEKMNMEGITQHNLDVAEAEFFFLHLATDDSDKVMAAADFYNKFGDILYYKNGVVNNHFSNLFLALYFWGYDLGALKDAICKPFLKKNKEGGKDSMYHEQRKKVENWFNERADDKQKDVKNRTDLIDYLKKEVSECIDPKSVAEIKFEKILDDSFEERVPLEKVLTCVSQRDNFTQKGMRSPCYACKYYNQSLNMELERMLNWEWSAEKRKMSKSVIVARLLLEDEWKIRNMRETQYGIIADTLKGLGCTFMGCANEREKIEDDFLEAFLKILGAFYSKQLISFPSFSLGKLGKAMLLFWEASIFYEMTGDSRTSYELNKYLIKILIAYLKVHPDKVETIRKYLPDIKKCIVNHAIMDLYAHYDHIHLAEIQRMKAIYVKDTYEDIDLGALSISPDIEELLYEYYMLEMYCLSNGGRRGELYKSGLMGPYKHICTLTQDIQNLKVKAFMNEQTLQDLLGERSGMFTDCKSLDGVRFYRNVGQYMRSEDPIRVEGLYEKEEGSWNRINLLNFLIVDSLFCLAKIIDVVSPLNNTTLYTNSFIGEICEHLWKWTIIFELTYLCYKAVDGSDKNVFETLERKYEMNFLLDKPVFDETVDEVRKNVRKVKWGKCEKESISRSLKREVQKLIGADTFRHLTRTDQLENVIRYYNKAVEMHSEGRAYKEMIRTLFFLDDDLNNDTCQLSFSIERFLINSGWIRNRMEKLRDMVVSSAAYNSENYFN